MHQNEPPPPFHGGIIADPPGLGKSLTMIALAATDREAGSSLFTEDAFSFDEDDQKPYSTATLVIVAPQREHVQFSQDITEC